MHHVWTTIGRRLLFAAAAAVALACSVKEDRTECPVYVTVLTDRFAQRGISEGLISFSTTRLLSRDSVSFLSRIRDAYVKACPRDFAQVSVLAGVEGGILSDGTLQTPRGSQADLIWAYGTSFSAWADEYTVDAVPHKQFCLVHFLFDGSSTAPEDYPWRFRLRAECSGMDLYTLEPVAGSYNATVGPNALGEWYGVLPRQRANNMLLEVYLPEPGNPALGRTDYVFDLGEAFERQGYDWTLEDLPDIEIQVGFVYAGLTLTVQPWEGPDEFSQIEI
jgi:hypothetical protein